LRLLRTKNNLQDELDEFQIEGEYVQLSVFRDEEGNLRYNPGGFENLRARRNLREVPVLTTQRQRGGVHIEPQTQLDRQEEPNQDDVYRYENNPMRPGYVRNEVRRIDDGRRPPPPQQPRLFGLAPSPIAGQPTFQPRQADIGYEDLASRIDAPRRADTPPRGVRRQREADINPVEIAADRIQTIMETGERGPERDAALTRSISGLERNQLNQLRAQLRARGLYDNVTIRNGKIFGNGLKKKTKK